MFSRRFNKFIWAAWIITGIASAFFFLKRNDFSSYTHWSNYSDLYPAKGPGTKELANWKECRTQYSEEEKEAGKKLSATEAGIKENDPVLTKTIKLGQWIIHSLWQCKTGRPSDSVDRLRPMAILETAKARKTPVWCGTYGALFLFFCTCQNITCRYIESIGKTDSHVINECYIPELRKWIMVDLTHKIITATDNKGNYLNTVDIKNIYNNNLSKNVNVLYVKDSADASWAPADSIKTEWKFYLGGESVLRYYHLIYLTMAYKSAEKAKRYFLPTSWYEVYSEEPESNAWFFTRSFITIFWLLISIFIFLSFFKLKRNP
ncbi:MAG TPA: hypothetical protein VHD35_02985 [Chitinophagaceae bacterium]|nr:hypothetical protein [Chitinophagaceae bacterium]